jgi:hypothetical protein
MVAPSGRRARVAVVAAHGPSGVLGAVALT